MENNQMPHNLEAEAALLGCILLDEETQSEILEELIPEDFYQESHREILRAMKAIYGASRSIDLVTLTDRLEKDGKLERAGGVSAVSELARLTPSAANYKHYLEIVRRDSSNRMLIRASKNIIQKCMESPDQAEAVPFAEEAIYNVSRRGETTALKSLEDGVAVLNVISKFEAIQNDPDAYRGVETGFPRLDYITNGLQKSDLIVLAARPGAGKTSLAMNIVENACLRKGKVVAVFSLEMSREQIIQRLICSYAGVSMSNALHYNKLKGEDWRKLMPASDKIMKSKLYIDDNSNIKPAEILSKCRRLKSKEGRLDLVMIDYLQLMQSDERKKGGNDENRTQQVADITRSLKIMAKELDVPVLALSQLRRFQGKEAQLSDLRESGAIEQDADIVMFINRMDQNSSREDIESGKVIKGASELKIEKHRNGETGRISLRFIGEQTKFVEVDEQGRPEEEPVYAKRKNIQTEEGIPYGDEGDGE